MRYFLMATVFGATILLLACTKGYLPNDSHGASKGEDKYTDISYDASALKTAKGRHVQSSVPLAATAKPVPPPPPTVGPAPAPPVTPPGPTIPPGGLPSGPRPGLPSLPGSGDKGGFSR